MRKIWSNDRTYESQLMIAITFILKNIQRNCRNGSLLMQKFSIVDYGILLCSSLKLTSQNSKLKYNNFSTILIQSKDYLTCLVWTKIFQVVDPLIIEHHKSTLYQNLKNKTNKSKELASLIKLLYKFHFNPTHL